MRNNAAQLRAMQDQQAVLDQVDAVSERTLWVRHPLTGNIHKYQGKQILKVMPIGIVVKSFKPRTNTVVPWSNVLQFDYSTNDVKMVENLLKLGR